MGILKQRLCRNRMNHRLISNDSLLFPSEKQYQTMLSSLESLEKRGKIFFLLVLAVQVLELCVHP